jgi:hypothetical protein
MTHLLEARDAVRKDLRWLRNKLDRLLSHLDHMDAGDLDRIAPVLHAMLTAELDGVPKIRHELRAIHDRDQCQRDREREGLLVEPPPVAGKSLWRRFWEL